MTRFVGLDVSQKLIWICVVDDAGRRLWRGQCHTDPEQIQRAVRGHAGDDASIGIETGRMTPWLVHELRERELNVVCLDARHASAALKMQMNKTDRNDAEGLAQIMQHSLLSGMSETCWATSKGITERWCITPPGAGVVRRSRRCSWRAQSTRSSPSA